MGVMWGTWKRKWKLPFRVYGVYGYYPLIVENQVEQKMENETEPGIML